MERRPRRKWLKTLTLVFCVTSMGCNSTSAAREQTKLPQELRAPDSADVGKTSVAAPLGRFLLVKRGTTSCVIKFTGFRREGNYEYAEYDWHHQEDGSGDYSKPNVLSGHGRLRDTPSIGIGRFAFKPTATLYVTCGSLEVFWGYPIALTFSRNVGGDPRTDPDLELAPTKLINIRDVNLRDPRLKWYKLDDGRPRTTFIPLEDLPY
jgi:hypothetical protein